MAVTFNRTDGIKYTEMCMYIDENMQYVTKTGEFPEIENKIFEYLYHVFYALSKKEGYFRRWEDYDEYSLYGASQLYILMRDKYVHAGEVSRGKVIVPVKNTLDFIKSVMFPFKVNYQKQTYATIINPEVDQDTSILKENLKQAIVSDYQTPLEDDLKDILIEAPKILHKILNNTPYRNDKLMIKRLYISVVLTFISDVTIPNHLQKKTKSSSTDNFWLSVDWQKINAKPDNIYLWHLNPELKDYVRILVIKLKKSLTDRLEDDRAYTDLSDEMIDGIMKSAYATYDSNEENI